MSPVPGRVVVVGGGLAGHTTCAELRARGYDGELLLVDSGPAPYDRPPLSKNFLLGSTGRGEIDLAKPEWYAEQGIQLRVATTVTSVRPDVGAVEFGGDTVLACDVVVLATGARPRKLPVPGGDLAQVRVLGTVDDAIRLRDDLMAGVRLLIVGAGLIGAEVASTARKLGAAVDLVDPIDPPLAAVLGPEVARMLHDQHARHGITTHAGVVTALSAQHGGGPVRARLSTGRLVEADVVLAATGVRPATELAVTAGIDVAEATVVDERGRTSNPALFAAGDSTRTRDSRGVLHRTSAHWEAALRGGRRVAAGILGRQTVAEGCGWFWSDRHDVHVEAVGDMTAPGVTVVRGAWDSSSLVVFRVDGERLRGAVAVDGGIAIRAARRIIDRRLPVDPAALADESVDLRKLSTARKT